MEHNSKYRLILFDLDGTLIHSAPDVYVSINAALAKMNLDPITYEKSIKAIGPGAEKFMYTILGNDNKHLLNEFIETFKPIYRQNCIKQTKPFRGVLELLQTLTGLDLAVITNKAIETATIILKHLHLLQYFKLVVGPEMVAKIKPAPDMVNYCLQHFKRKATEVLVIGDTDNDIIAAQAAGVDVCAVGWGYGDINELAAFHPTYLVKTPQECGQIIFNNRIKTYG